MIEICILIKQFQLNISHPSLKVPRLFQLTQMFPQSISFLSSFSPTHSLWPRSPAAFKGKKYSQNIKIKLQTSVFFGPSGPL